MVFAEDGDQNTLGDNALLGMGLEIDRETQSLREIEAFPAYAVSTSTSEILLYM